MSFARRIKGVNPLYAGSYLFLWAGVALATYNGLAWLDVVPRVQWISWSHTHYLTIGAFTQFTIGYLPQLVAEKLKRPTPSRLYSWVAAAALNGGFVLLWYGRSFGNVTMFDVGVSLIWLLALGLFLALFKMAMQSDRAWDVSVAFSLLAAFVFLWGITYAYGLFAHVWQLPGGWTGLREAHVHANTWGFLVLATVGALYHAFPGLVGAELYSDRLKNYSFWFFAAGIFPLITGPWLGIRAVTVSGLSLYTVGFVFYYYTLIQTYRLGIPSGSSLWLLIAQFWIVGPGFAAPLLLFEVGWVRPTFLEQGLIHFFFMGWALPVLLIGISLDSQFTSEHTSDTATGGIDSPSVRFQSPISRWMVWTWNGGLIGFGTGFFLQQWEIAPFLFGLGAATLLALWVYVLVYVFRARVSDAATSP
jgi:cytochrome c oxidase cbb3-type subunit 1